MLGGLLSDGADAGTGSFFFPLGAHESLGWGRMEAGADIISCARRSKGSGRGGKAAEPQMHSGKNGKQRLH